MPTLRRTETSVLWLANACLVVWYYGRLVAPFSLPTDGVNHVRVSILLGGFHAVLFWFLGIIAHGVLVPTAPQTALLRGAAIILAACAPVVLAGLQHPAVRDTWPTLLATNVLAIGSASGIMAYTAYRMTALRREASEARRELRELGQYRLVRRLGAGGMGEVHLAEHRLLKRPCAVKLIRPDQAGRSEFVARFEREVRATAALRHPNAVEIYDYGRHADGSCYYVMEYIDGLSLDEVLARESPLPPGRVVHVLRQLCGAVVAAHAAGVVHRDIKPSNVMVKPGAGVAFDHVKLLDFGLAKSIGPGAGTELTRSGAVVGTPAYMSPEQAAGLPADGRSDLYSLGAVGYRLVTGRRPFERGTAMEMIAAHLLEAPTPPSAVCPGVPGDLESVLLRCLEKDPAARFVDAETLDAALSGCECAHTWTARDAAGWWKAAPVHLTNVSDPTG